MHEELGSPSRADRMGVSLLRLVGAFTEGGPDRDRLSPMSQGSLYPVAPIAGRRVKEGNLGRSRRVHLSVEKLGGAADDGASK
jgi:hypothetical protein